ncbi:MAG: N-acetylmuramoyl-L-alanine amidase [bacterium]
MFGVSLSFGDPISVALHARWTPDLTANSPQPQCVTSGTVAGFVQFHVIANYSPPVIGFGVDSIDIVEQTDVHEPFHYHSDNPISGETYTSPPYSVCSSPPTGYQTWVVCNLNVPMMTFSFHNTNYVVTANYHYIVFTGAYPPSPSNPMYRRVDASLSITVKFDNLIVETQPDYLINNPGGDNHNTTITFQLKSAQKKLCSAKISIYTSAGQLVKQETVNNLICPGTHTYTWDGKLPQHYPPGSVVAPKGIYPYDIEIMGACPYDTDSRCSKALKIIQTRSEIVGGLEDCSQWDGSSIASPLYPKVGYVLEDSSGKNASNAKITVFNGDAQMLGEEEDGTATNIPDTANPIWNEKTLSIRLTGRSPYVFLVSAIDDHPEIDKAHRRKPALQKNSKQKKTKYRVLLDAGHGNGDPGSLGTKYWDENERRNKDRYTIQEDEMNQELVQRVILWLNWHNERNKYYEYDPIDEVERLEWPNRTKWVAKYTNHYKDTKLLISIHHDGIAYPYSDDVANYPMWVENGNDKFDRDLASSMKSALGALSLISLPKDTRFKAHPETSQYPNGDPDVSTDQIRSNEKWYCLFYEEPRQVTPKDNGWGIMARAKCSATLLEVATITNYDEEDYRLSSLSEEWAWSNIADMIAYLIHRGMDYFINMHP